MTNTPISSMMNPLQLADIAFGGSFDDAACAFYKVAVDYETTDSPQISKQRSWSPAVPFVASFERLTELTSICVDTSISESRTNKDFTDMHAFTKGISLLLRMVTDLTEASSSPGPLIITWNAEAWLNNILRPLGHEVYIGFILGDINTAYSHVALLFPRR